MDVYTNSMKGSMDSIPKIFNDWYEVAKQSANGLLSDAQMIEKTKQSVSLFLCLDNEKFLQNGDDYEVRSRLDHLSKIFLIYSTKPKFTRILFTREGKDFLSWLESDCLNPLKNSCISPFASVYNRIECGKVLTSIYQLCITSINHESQVYKQSPIRSILNNDLILVAAKAHEERELREVMGKLIITMGIATNTEASAAKSLISYSAADELALKFAWEMGALKYDECTELILSQIKKKSSTVLVDSLTASTSYLAAVMSSLTNVLLANTNINAKENGFDKNIFYEILIACRDGMRIKEDEDEEKSFGDSSDEFHKLIKTLVDIFPSSEQIAEIILPLHPTLKDLSFLLRICQVFTEKVWINKILPYLHEFVLSMSTSGVSGNRKEQEIIDIVRECVRIYYLSNERRPTKHLGFTLLKTLLQAIRRGYITTERFNEISARIIITHIKNKDSEFKNDSTEGKTIEGTDNIPSSIDWIRTILNNEICDNYRNQRAVSEIVMLILGLENSSLGLEIVTEDPLSSEDARDFLTTLVQIRNKAADLLFTELIMNYPNFFLAKEYSLIQMIKSIEEEVGDLILCKQENLSKKMERLESIGSLVEMFIKKCISPSTAHLAFDLMLKIVVMDPQAKIRFNDEVFASLIEKMSRNSILNRSALDTAYAVGGIATRTALAYFAPYLCLRDREASVRIAAMEYLMGTPHLLTAYGNYIVESCLPTIDDAEDIFSSLSLDELQLADASAPVLAALAIADSTKLSVCVNRLLIAAILTAKNDSMSETSSKILNSLNRIAREGSLGEITEYIYHGKRSNIEKLRRLSPEWENLCMSSGFARSRAFSVYAAAPLKKTGSTVANGDYNLFDDILEEEEVKPEINSSIIFNDSLLVYDTMIANDKAGKLMDALQAARLMKSRHFAVWKERNVSKYLVTDLLPRIAEFNLPKASSIDRDGFSTFTDSDLNDYKKYAICMREMQFAAPEECESCLGLSTLFIDFTRSKMLQIQKAKGVKEARSFLQEENIHSPQLFSILGKMEVSKRESLSFGKETQSNQTMPNPAQSMSFLSVMNTKYLSIQFTPSPVISPRTDNPEWKMLTEVEDNASINGITESKIEENKVEAKAEIHVEKPRKEEEKRSTESSWEIKEKKKKKTAVLV